jgi:hypothetical protein
MRFPTNSAARNNVGDPLQAFQRNYFLAGFDIIT